MPAFCTPNTFMAGLLAAAGALPSLAAPLDYRIDFTGTTRSCIRVVFCFDNPITPFSGSFTLDDAALAGDGAVDIAGTIVLGLLQPYTTVPGASQSFTALALVQGGAVVDVSLHGVASYSATSPFTGTTSGTSRFDGQGGTWSHATSVVNTGIPTSSSSEQHGSYTITQVPEPGTWALWLGGLGLAAALRTGRGRFKA